DDILKALNMSSDSVPFVAGELLRDGCCYSDRVSKLSNTMDNTYYASSEGLGGNGVDRYHFNHDAYVTIGKRYAEQMLKAINRAPVEPVPQEPFGSVANGEAVAGEPAAIPGKIEAENYDITGVGTGNSSYSDEDSENKGGEYRKDGVDIEKGGDNFAVGYTMNGEWMEYTVNVAAAGKYVVTANVASGSETSGFELFMDDKQIGTTVSVPKTGDDWSVFKAIEVGTVELAAGKQVLKLAITGNYVNIDWISFDAEKTTDSNESVNPGISGEIGDAVEKLAVQLNPGISQKFRVFDMNGKFLGAVETRHGEVKAGLKAAGYNNGIYLLQSANGAKRIVQVMRR
ncbi:MAG: carbohydrate-binding protein, partial [Fibrobacter sp.]|nr:carbohydrate-binding protein [Fibrobacter sp.]